MATAILPIIQLFYRPFNSIPSDPKKYLKRCFYCHVGLSTLRTFQL